VTYFPAATLGVAAPDEGRSVIAQVAGNRGKQVGQPSGCCNNAPNIAALSMTIQ